MTSFRAGGSTDRAAKHVAVVGGGITGLAAAHRLVSQSPDVKVTLLESSSRLGGIIRTEEADGFLMELGPDSFITNKPAGVQLCEEIGYLDQLIPTDATYRRSLVLRNGKPQPVPDGFMLMAPARPWSILTTPVLSLAGKVRLLAERVIAAKQTDDDESLASFVRRRFGDETLDRLVQPLIGGIYTSDPEKLSLKATLPRFLEMERTYGSVIKATLAQERQKRQQESPSKADNNNSSGSGARYGLFTAPKLGLADMVRAIEDRLAASERVSIQRKTVVDGVRPDTGDDESSGWTIDFAGSRPAESFDAVIITLPTHQTARLFNGARQSELASELRSIEYASTAIVVSGHQLCDFEHPLNAFGLVIPAIENREILAVSFTSRKFPQRAPEGHVLLRTFVGGAMQPELLERDDDETVGSVNRELTAILGMRGEPLFSEVVRYNNAMPQYHVGHLARVARLEELAGQQPGLELAGSAYHGVGIPDSIAGGRAAADRVLASRCS